MICPQCRAEYRQGFTRCADCDINLVYEPPAAANGVGVSGEASAQAENSDDPFCAFWQGDDARLHADLCSILDDAGIPHKTVRRRDHLFNLSNYTALQIGVPFSLFEEAETAVKDAFDLDPSIPGAVQNLNAPLLLSESSGGIRKLPSTLTAPSDENIPGPPTDGNPSDWQSETATVEVWSGDDTSLCDMLVASLRENQIFVRRDNPKLKQSLFVIAADEDHAREIVREIVEGASAE